VTNVTGPLDYSFRLYVVDAENWNLPAAATPNMTLAAVSPTQPGEFSVGSFNMERFFDTVNDPAVSDVALSPAAFDGRLNKASLAIRTVLQMPDILVVYYSRHGATAALARQVVRGIESVSGASAQLRTVPELVPSSAATDAAVPADGPPYATHDELRDCDGLVLGSPTRFGNMAAPLKHFLDGTSALWLNGALDRKPAGVFTSTSTMHGGQEATLLSMMIPLLHHGMYLVGLPYTAEALNRTRSGGTPYGASHVSGRDRRPDLTEDERDLARLLGQRIAELAGHVRRDR
jgi:NAD(P)H dehydrogenase (quinone)